MEAEFLCGSCLSFAPRNLGMLKQKDRNYFAQKNKAIVSLILFLLTSMLPTLALAFILLNQINLH